MNKTIKSALLSVFHKDGLDQLVTSLHKNNVQLYATGGTFDFIQAMNIPVIPVENITGYPSILDGRVKTLHPAVFGGILAIRDNEEHKAQMEKYQLPFIDLVVVDLYPFEKTVSTGATEEDIIEKIDIGGISLIRGAAKNFNDVVIIPSVNDYSTLQNILDHQAATTSLEQRKNLAMRAFAVSSQYDGAIYSWFSQSNNKVLRYGENPHQKASFSGDLSALFEQLNGKELSYNNLLDVDAALGLIQEFNEPTAAVIKHNNACGIATRPTIKEAWDAALAGDPVSAFGGVIAANQPIDKETAQEINKLFFEILCAPGFSEEALAILQSKKNRIILQTKPFTFPSSNVRSILNGVLVQERDHHTECKNDLKFVTNVQPSEQEINDLLFAAKVVKHTKSNAIVLVKNGQLCASGTGQTSRIDALQQAIAKAAHFGFDLQGAVMASDAFFPFPDCVEIAAKAGITSVIQPGGSLKDQDSIDKCNELKISMAMTGFRHFKH
ncbi:MAG: bifunctional phosphoribosylaminoimidazolecarboxamide formyltransferase/IMP cyclohydrolase [Bacteroidota bacterium]